MSGDTWFMDDREFTLDYVCIDSEGLACVVEAVIMDELDVVYSHHATVITIIIILVSVSIACKVKIKLKERK